LRTNASKFIECILDLGLYEVVMLDLGGDPYVSSSNNESS